VTYIDACIPISLSGLFRYSSVGAPVRCQKSSVLVINLDALGINMRIALFSVKVICLTEVSMPEVV
jgi:hypothetical protein